MAIKKTKSEPPRKIGAPRKHDRDVLLKNFLEYIESTDIPIVAEFAYKNGLNRTSVYEIPELADAIKLCITKKECQLEKGALTGTLNNTMAIFSLKQLGWKDKTETALTGADGGPLEISVSFVDATSKD